MKGRTMDKIKDEFHNPNPEQTANVLSRVLFWWLNPLLRLGNKKDLEEEDLYDVLKCDSSKFLAEKFEKNWNEELLKFKNGKKPSLFWAFFKTFRTRYMLWAILAIAVETIRIVQPILLGQLIWYFNPNSKVELWEAYLYAVGIGLCSLVPAVTFYVYSLAVYRFGMWMRIGASALMYKKCLRLSVASLGKTSVGQIVNLMSNDVQKFDPSLIIGHFVVIAPLQMIAVFIILWHKINWSVVPGMAVLLLMIPISAILGRVFAILRSKTASHTDERVRVTNEMLNAMRTVKMYCWEKLFMGLIQKSRKSETFHIMRSSYARAMAMAPFFYSAKLISFMTFLTFVLMGNRLTADVVFVTLSLYTPLRITLNYYIPLGAQYLSEGMVAAKRVQEFLMMEEIKLKSSPELPSSTNVEKKLTVSEISASWDESSSHSILQDVSFEVKPGELLAVIGPVGAGKTSLLMAILGELSLTKGNIDVSGQIGYVSQQAWVFGASVRQNITFGGEFDSDKYSRVVEAASLKRDFELMSDGDQTLVGDRGASLSGGQKARISLARALYRDADIYLLDDPLSAVDAHVSSHIFHKCICGYLKSKVRILVTHQLQYLPLADRILILSRDKQVQIGTFDELSRVGVEFGELLKHDVVAESSGKPSPGFMANGKVKSNRISSTDDDDVSLPDVTFTEGSPAKKRLATSALSKSYSHVSGDFFENSDGFLRKSLLSKSMDLRRMSISKKEETDQNSLGMLASYVSSISLPRRDDDVQEEYVPQVQEEEKRMVGNVKPSLYGSLFYTGGGVLGCVLLALLNILAQITFILADWWLAYWCNSIEVYLQTTNVSYSENDTFPYINTTSDQMTFWADQTTAVNATDQPITTFPHNTMYLKIFAGLTASVVLFAILRAIYGFHIVVVASKNLHNKMISAILRCPISFFDQNPIGRILNRFSKDLGQLDELLPFYMYDFIQCLLLIIGIFLVVGITNPWVFIAIVPVLAMFAYLRRYFLKTIRNVKRLEATTKSPTFSHVSTSILGMQTIRSYRVEQTFVDEFYSYQDSHTSAFFTFGSLARWFALRLEFICSIFITIIALCAVFAAQSLNGSMVGLSLNYAMTLMMLLQWGVRQSSEVESLMTSVERIIEYAELPPESQLESKDDVRPSSDWPKEGAITAQSVCLKYKEDGPTVLNDLTFAINPSEKIGIVGRTGAGKSSLIALLFRLVEPDGKLCIDDVDITGIGLHDLRPKISIIPQDPVLLTGSVRKNLDPLDFYSDLQIWHALKQVQLNVLVEEMQSGLESEIQESGSNLSMGQRQLFCLARAILKSNKILVIDEATANVDPKTDGLIQKTIRKHFEDCTVLTIAHRLNTIIDSDRIMVLDAGCIVEFDRPHTLLQNKDGFFYKMAEQTGPTEFQQLLVTAKEVTLDNSSKRI